MRKLRLVVWLAVLVALFGLGALTIRWLGLRDAAPVQAERAMPDAPDAGRGLPGVGQRHGPPDRSALAPATPAPDAGPGLPAGPSPPPAGSPPGMPDRSARAPATPLGGAFALIDHNGKPITEAVFRGKPSAVFFGYTHCPDICPTTLMNMIRWAETLGPNADRMRFVFVTVDPERDTPAVLDEYVSAFSDKIIGITGEPDELRSMLTDYDIPFSKVPRQGGGYDINHPASIVLLDESGSIIGTISRQEGPEAALGKLRSLVEG